MHQTRRWKQPQEVVSTAAFDPLHLLIKWTYSSQLETQTGCINKRELGIQSWIPNSHGAIFLAGKKGWGQLNIVSPGFGLEASKHLHGL